MSGAMRHPTWPEPLPGGSLKSVDALKKYKVCVERVSKHMKKLILIGGGMLLLLVAVLVLLWADANIGKAKSAPTTIAPNSSSIPPPIKISFFICLLTLSTQTLYFLRASTDFSDPPGSGSGHVGCLMAPDMTGYPLSSPIQV